MKTKAPNAGVKVAPGNWQNLRYSRKGPVEGCVEARDLDDTRQAFPEGFDQRNFAGEVRQIEWLRSAKFLEQAGGYHLVPVQPHAAVYDAMPNGLELFAAGPTHDPVDKAVGCPDMIGRANGDAIGVRSGLVSREQYSIRPPDAVNLADQNALRRLARRERRKLDGGRTSVDGENGVAHVSPNLRGHL
jgi:hypothetical protein